MKQEPLEGQNKFRIHQKLHLENCHYLTFLVLTFSWIFLTHQRNPLSPRYLAETVSNCLASHLPEVVVPTGAQQRLTKNLKSWGRGDHTGLRESLTDTHTYTPIHSSSKGWKNEWFRVVQESLPIIN